MAKNKKQELNKMTRVDILLELLNFALNNTDKFDIKLDKGGWIGLMTLIDSIKKAGYSIDREDSINIVQKNEDKKILQFINRSFVKSIKKSEFDIDFFKDNKIKELKND